MSFPTEVDIIVVGGGAAGNIIASRIAKASPNTKVAIVEAGQNNLDMPTVVQPAMYLSHLAPGSTTASFYQAKPSVHLGGKAPIVPIGQILGGGSSINFMMKTNAAAIDYDDWDTPGWTFDDLLPLVKKSETYDTADFDRTVHGDSGPIHISAGGHQSDLGDEFLDSVKKHTDIPFTKDIQNFTSIGASTWNKYINKETGRRQDTAHTYLHPLMKTAENISLITEHKTIRILFEGTKAIGIEFCFNSGAKTAAPEGQTPVAGETFTMKARQMVIISAGAFGSPMLLERSGVGAKAILEKLDIPVVVDLPGVGLEYQDHQLSLAVYHASDDADTHDDYLRGIPEVHVKEGTCWAKDGSGKVASNMIDAGIKGRPNAKEVLELDECMQEVWKRDYADRPGRALMFGGVISALLADHSAVPGGNYFMMGAYMTYPLSKGSLHITSKSDPFAAPDFDAGFFSDPSDISANRWMFKKLREVARRMPSFRGEFAAIHPKYAEDSPARCVPFTATTEAFEDFVYSKDDDEKIDDWLRENIGTTWHSCSTNPMKPREIGGVVDGRLNVYGTTNLKVADLSIIPYNVGCNTYSTAIIIGEKASMLIAEDLGIQGV